MHIQSITLQDFRSYERLHLEMPDRLTVFHGPNAAGKTNIIEAIQLLTSLQTFRRARASDMIRQGAKLARISMDISDGNRLLTPALSLDRGSRHYSLNGKGKRTADMRGLLPSVAFTPDDLELMKGGSAQRRSALDALGSQVHANYHIVQLDFEKVLRHKNRVLKEGDTTMLDAVNELFIRVGAQLERYRMALFGRLEPHIKSHYAHLAQGEELAGVYLPSWMREDTRTTYGAENLSESQPPSQIIEQTPHLPQGQPLSLEETQAHLEAAVLEKRDLEVAAKRTLVGPNHDVVSFAVNGLDASKFASQGQQRSAVLAWKLAEAEVLEETLGMWPILLLDDVMSELDSQRRDALIEFLNRDTQVFITTANLDYFSTDTLANTKIVKLPLQTA